MPNNILHKIRAVSRAGFFILLSAAPFAKASEHCPVPRTHVASEAEAKALAKRVTAAYKLTSIPVDCLDFNPDREAMGVGFEFNVHEVHSEKCGGVTGFSPRVFSLKMLPDGRITSDANRIDGEYKPLRCPIQRHAKKKM